MTICLLKMEGICKSVIGVIGKLCEQLRVFKSDTLFL